MKLAHYKDRVALTISEKEYIAAHRRFGRGSDRLRASLTVIIDAQGQTWIDIRISEHGSLFGRANSKSGDWVVQWWRSDDEEPFLPLFGQSEIGRFDPDKDGVELFKLPERVAPIRPWRGVTVQDAPVPEVAAPPEPEGPPSVITEGSGWEIERRRDEVNSITSHVSLDQLKHAAAILNAGSREGYTPLFEDGRITGFRAEFKI